MPSKTGHITNLKIEIWSILLPTATYKSIMPVRQADKNMKALQ